MLRLALAGHRGLRISRYDLDRSGPPYTIETLRHFRKRYPRASFFFIMGSDSLMQFPRWKRFHEILRFCRLAVAPRPGFAPRQLPLSVRLGVDCVKMSALPISSTQLRRRLSRGQDVKKFLVPRVAAYIRRKSLYGFAS
jgi:nicotinate-nucleotide adenylyltransferase